MKFLQAAAAGLLAVILLAACSSNTHNSQMNRSNAQSLGNNLKYRESLTVHDEGRLGARSGPELSTRIAQELATMDGVHTAHVLLDGEQAFVAVTLADGRGAEVVSEEGAVVSRYMKGAISDKIRMMEPQIRHVYVTDQKEYVTRFEAIRSDLGAGGTGEALLREMSESIRRIFPGWSLGGSNPPPAAPQLLR